MLLAVAYSYFYAKLFMNVLGQVLCAVNASVLSSRTSEAEHKAGESALDIPLDVGVGKLVDTVQEEQNLAIAGNNLLHNTLQSLLKLSLILRTSNQRAHIERENQLRLQILGHVAIHHTVGDTLGNGGLSDTRLAHENRVILGSARENLQHTASLLITTDYGV